MKKKLSVVVVAMLTVVGCGREDSPEAASVNSDQTQVQFTVELTQAQAENAFRGFLRGVMTEDEALVRAALSTDRVERMDRFGGMKLIRHEREKFVRLWGANADANLLSATEVVGQPGSPLVGVNFSYNGAGLDKVLYFVLEAGVYKASLRMPAQGMEGMVVGPNGGYATFESGVSTSTYRIRNKVPSARNYEITVNGLPQVFNITRTYQDRTADDNCLTLFDGMKPRGQNSAGTWSNYFECDWNSTGDDFFNNTGDQWQCTSSC